MSNVVADVGVVVIVVVDVFTPADFDINKAGLMKGWSSLAVTAVALIFIGMVIVGCNCCCFVFCIVSIFGPQRLALSVLVLLPLLLLLLLLLLLQLLFVHSLLLHQASFVPMLCSI